MLGDCITVTFCDFKNIFYLSRQYAVKIKTGIEKNKYWRLNLHNGGGETERRFSETSKITIDFYKREL